jgi:GT2 family glycosyltransferase
MSIDRDDLLAINGFDERYKGPGTGEDSDIDYRLKLLGVESRGLANMAVQYHLWHQELGRPNANEALFEEVQRLQQAITPFGIKKA